MSEEAPGPQTETIRIHQANERTMLAWSRTGIALMAFGFALARVGILLGDIARLKTVASQSHERVATTGVGAALVALGMLTNLFATLRYAQIRQRIERGEVGAPSATMVYVFGAMATAVGAAMTILLLRAIAE